VKVLQLPIPGLERRRPENRLKRSMIEAEQLEDRVVDYWLSLADVAFEGSREKETNEQRKAA
jgi:hypothetical protein